MKLAVLTHNKKKAITDSRTYIAPKDRPYALAIYDVGSRDPPGEDILGITLTHIVRTLAERGGGEVIAMKRFNSDVVLYWLVSQLCNQYDGDNVHAISYRGLLNAPTPYAAAETFLKQEVIDRVLAEYFSWQEKIPSLDTGS